MKKILTILILTSISSTSLATATWYTGTINRIWPNSNDGGFILTFTPPSSIADCQYDYGNFTNSAISLDRLKNSFSLALSAFHTGATVGVVIDKGTQDERCDVLSIDIRK